jgi:heptosyltransferase-3
MYQRQERNGLEPTPVADLRLSYIKMQRILVIRACAIGDFVLNLPALAAVQKMHPCARFTLVGYPSTLELAREFVAVESVFSIEAQPWSRLFYEPVPDLKFDAAIVWMKDPTVSANIQLSGIPNVLRADPFPLYGHVADHLLRTLILDRPNLPDLWRRQTDEVIIHPTSGSPQKIWPHLTSLVNKLSNPVVLLGPSPSGRGQGEGHNFEEDSRPSAALRAASPRGRGILFLENLPLPEVSQHLRRCRAYIGNDSGITHLAAYLGCPTVALFGPTDPRVWGPIGRRARIIWKSKLEDISVNEVLLALRG